MIRKHTESHKKEMALKIKGFRERKNCTQEDLAKILHTSVFCISRWETAKNYPTGAAVKLMKILGVLKDEE